MKIKESVLDNPQPSLDPAVWTSDENGNIFLTLDAEQKIQKAIDYIQSKFKFPNLKVYIIGSITSNSYSSESDIDINLFDETFKDLSEEDRLKLATEVKQDFQYNYMDIYPAESMIGTHPFEIYIQNNVFKCFASVGCYDFINKKWEVGPDFKELDFDPISHYYKKSMKFAKSFVEQLRNLILEIYENALITQKTTVDEFKSKQQSELVKKLKNAKQLYKDIKTTRAKFDDDLNSEEDAEKRRRNEKWHTVDAAYKFMDKFGYIHILKDLVEMYNKIENNEYNDNIENNTIKIIKDGFTTSKNINDSEKMLSEVENKVNNPCKIKIWIDDVRPAPNGYIWIKSVDDFIEFIERNSTDCIEVIDTDHDAGDFQKFGGDYIRVFDYLDFIKAEGLNVRVHSANPVGIQNIRRIIKKNGWNEIQNIIEGDIVDESIKWYSPNGNFQKKGSKFDCKFPPLDQKTAKKLTGLDMVEFTGEDNGIKSCVGCNSGGRAYAVIEKNGIYIPFYVSSGDGDKDKVPTGHWYPFFGKGKDGWLNKGSQNDILNYYGSEQLKQIAKILDSKLNMNTLVKFDPVHGSYLKGFPYCMAASSNLKNIYNRDVKPVELGNKLYKKNIDDFLMAIGDFPLYESILEEGAKEVITSGILATLLAIPGILPAKTVQNTIKAKSEYSQVINDLNQKTKMLGNYTRFQAANIIARTLFAEARNDGEEGMRAVASVIYTRANSDPKYFAEVCKMHGYSEKAKRIVHQFSCWNKMTEKDWNPSTFKIKIPSSTLNNKKDDQLWKQAMLITSEMLTNSFKPIVNANMYYNPDKANPDWGNQLKKVKKIGNHKFGTLKNHSKFFQKV